MTIILINALNQSVLCYWYFYLLLIYGFDYYWPASLGVPFLQTKTSYLEHFARDKNEKGLHSSFSGNPMDDFDRDRALSPTSYLKKIRKDVINKILED